MAGQWPQPNHQKRVGRNCLQGDMKMLEDPMKLEILRGYGIARQKHRDAKKKQGDKKMKEIGSEEMTDGCFPSRIEGLHLTGVTDVWCESGYREVCLFFRREGEWDLVCIKFDCGKGQCFITCEETTKLFGYADV